MTFAALEQFPLDGRLYCLISAGQMHEPSTSLATPRVRIGLAEMIDPGEDKPTTYARSANGAVKLVFINEAAGTIPTLFLGSFWRDQTLQPGYRLAGSMHVKDAVLPVQPWKLLTMGSAGLLRNADRSTNEFPVAGEDAAGRSAAFADMPVVHCHTDTGLRLFIPAYEIFRRFYGPSTELANALLSGHWSREVPKLVDVTTSGVTDEGNYEIEPLVQLSDVACRTIALFETAPYAREQAMQIYLKIENARRAKNSTPWIEAVPPWNAQPMKLSFIGKSLGDNTALVQWIYTSQFPAVPYPIVRLTEQTLPEESEKVQRGPVTPALQEPSESDMPVISPPQDVRRTKAAWHIGIKDKWADLTALDRRATSFRKIRVNPEQPTEAPQKPRKRLSSGKRDEHGTWSPASLSSSESSMIRSRFSALARCFLKMLDEKQLRSTKDYALVSPAEIDGVCYCKFDHEVGRVMRPWALVDGRPRLCWVIELTRIDGQRYYWLEIEPKGNVGHRALVLRMLQNDAHLTAATLEEILKAIVLRKGVWKTNRLGFGENEFAFVTARHSFDTDKVRPSLVIWKMAELSTGMTSGC